MTAAPAAITPDLVAEHGLSPDEYGVIIRSLNRAPNITELGIFSVMWSEHCSYKSSKVWLKTLPTDGPQVIQGPGENAGVVDIGDGQAVVFKMESHNHPSFIEPYQGAATGVGGIMRDVFTMGARPIAMMNALRFGAPDHPKTQHLVSGVVAGIGGYGNCMGVPTVGGETNFHPAYNGNILVNAMCVGLADTDKIFYSAAKGVGNSIVYVGSKTGRDGIHGATTASAEFDDETAEKRPTVQVGDPFTEKLLLEACLELMAEDAIIAIQDMGAAGLTSSSVEMAAKGGVGVALDLDRVPQRETGMTPYEMMLSESQERMLMVLRPGAEDTGRRIFEKWGLDFAVIGETTDTNHLVLTHKGAVVADIPLTALVDSAPLYERPWTPTPPPADLAVKDVPAPQDLGKALLALIGSPDLASRRWIWEQYDSTVMADTVMGPGGDAAVVRVHGTTKAVAITTDVTPRYCFADPVQGGRQAVAEAWRNLVSVGAQPLAMTDCLNFGAPTRADIMGQIVGCIQGMGEAARALDFPVVAGNVGLLNENNRPAILPTPAIGGVGLIDHLDHRRGLGFTGSGHVLLLVGETHGRLGQSLYLREMDGREDGAPPPVDLDTERRNGAFIRQQILAGNALAVHDLSDGGLIVALAEMAMVSGLGARIAYDGPLPAHAYLFGEDQARYLVEAAPQAAARMAAAAAMDGVPLAVIGETAGDALVLNGAPLATVTALQEAHEAWLPALMEG
ncbi:MAG: phosphoribosylformylglycinamidine synthase subunit PurL [Alphaproteobacteria bacterium]